MDIYSQDRGPDLGSVMNFKRTSRSLQATGSSDEGQVNAKVIRSTRLPHETGYDFERARIAAEAHRKRAAEM